MREESGTISCSRVYAAAMEAEAWFEANAERWLEPLGERTIPSVLVPLSEVQARALLQFGDGGDEGVASVAMALTTAIRAVAPSGAFVKLSSRSPKDATIANSAMRRIYSEACASGEVDVLNPASIMRGLLRSSVLALRVRNGEEAVALLAASHRVREDIELALTREGGWEGGDTSTPLSLMIRPWIDAMEPHTEFRGVVVGHRLRAVTQYFSECYFDELQTQERKDELKLKIAECFHEVAPLLQSSLPSGNYIIDFAVLSDERVLVIELNPYAVSTGVGLFQWHRDQQAVFEADDLADFELRVQDRRMTKGLLKHAVMDAWREFIDHLYS